jgi:hypothetical protein
MSEAKKNGAQRGTVGKCAAERDGWQGSKWLHRPTRLAIYHRDGFCCVYCKRGLADGIELTVDHVLARELGGTNAATNLVTTCRACNDRKAAKSVKDFIATLGKRARGLAARIRKATRKALDRAEGRRLCAAGALRREQVGPGQWVSVLA